MNKLPSSSPFLPLLRSRIRQSSWGNGIYSRWVQGMSRESVGKWILSMTQLSKQPSTVYQPRLGNRRSRIVCPHYDRVSDITLVASINIFLSISHVRLSPLSKEKNEKSPTEWQLWLFDEHRQNKNLLTCRIPVMNAFDTPLQLLLTKLWITKRSH